MYVKSVAVAAQVLCIVSFGPLADSRKCSPSERSVVDVLTGFSILAQTTPAYRGLRRLDHMFDYPLIPIDTLRHHTAPDGTVDNHR